MGSSPPSGARTGEITTTAVGGRQAWVDALKVFLVGAVIVAHAAMTYGSSGSWFYREPSDSAVSAIIGVPIALGSLFVMGTFFFVAGCFVPASLARKGTARFIADRSVYLGVPVLAYVFVVVPLIELVIGWASGVSDGVRAVWARQVRSLDAGPLWFAAVLLLFSVVFATVVARRPVRPGPRRLGPQVLVAAALGIAAMSFVLRLRFPVDTFQIGALHVWQWGQCAGLFTLGTWAGAGGLAPVSASTLRWCRSVVVLGIVTLAALIALFDDDLDPLGGGVTWPAALVAVVEGAVSVSATVIVLDIFRDRPVGERSRRWATGAYGAYLLQAPVLVASALALRELPVPSEVKFLLVAPAATWVCFSLASRRRALTRAGA